MKRIALLIQYDGSHYSGWQKQKNATTVQEILDKAVKYILDPKFGTQNAKHAFLVEQVGLSQTEYLECLNQASNGGLVKTALWNAN